MPRQRAPPGPQQSHGQAPCCAGTGDAPSRGPGAVEGRRATRGPSPGGTGVPGRWLAPRMHIRSHVQTTWSTYSHLHMHTRLYTHHTLTHHTLTPPHSHPARSLTHARRPTWLPAAPRLPSVRGVRAWSRGTGAAAAHKPAERFAYSRGARLPAPGQCSPGRSRPGLGGSGWRVGSPRSGIRSGPLG